MNSNDQSNQSSQKDAKHPHRQATHYVPLVDESRLGFGQKLVYRRVPQAIGIYLAGSWTFLEFFESLISRHNISPHWQDISLLAIVLLFPSLLILAYRHGAPGAQGWGSVEKIGIPTNLLVTTAIIISQFASKDLGASAEMIQAMGPDGEMIQLERPKAEFRKRLAISYFTIDDVDLDEYLALGIPLAIETDLRQDPYITAYVPTNMATEIKKSDFTDLHVPLSLMLKISKEIRIEFLVVGSLKTENNKFIIDSKIYSVNDGLLVKEIHTVPHKGIFDAVDEISRQIKSAIGFSGGHINHFADLPVVEQMTSSMPAYLSYVKSEHTSNFRNDFKAAEQFLLEAIELDESFALATSQYAIYLFEQFRADEGLVILEKVKKHNYRLTDSRKFTLAALEALFSDRPDQAREIVKQWLELYPDSVDALQMKFTLHRLFSERLEAIEVLRRIIELEPFGTNRHLTIGKLYTSLGNLEAALEEFEKFLSKNPTNAQAILLIGNTNLSLGNFETARENFSRAKLLLTNDLSADRSLSDVLIREGNFSLAEKNIKGYINGSKSEAENYQSWKEISDYYWMRGQYKESLVALRNSYEPLKAFQAETTYLLIRSHDAWRFATAGNLAEGQQMIDDAKLLINTAGKLYTANITIAQARVYATQDQIETALSAVDEVSNSLEKMLRSGIEDQIFMFKGIIQYEGKMYLEASQNIDKYLQKHPTNKSSLMVAKGMSLFNLGQFSDAKDTFEEVLTLFPSHPRANLAMAKVELNEEEPESAIPFLEKALKAWEFADSTFEPAIEARELYKSLESI